MLPSVPTVLDSSTPIVQVISDYVEAFSPIDTQTDGRIVNCAAQQGSDSDELCDMAAGATAPVPAAATAGRGSLTGAVCFVALAAGLLLM